MKTYQELLTEKTKIRATDPLRYDVLTMILAGASALAKKDLREVTEEDLISSVKKEISNSEKAIELIRSKNGDTTKQENELKEYKSFLPAMLDESEILRIVDSVLETLVQDPSFSLSRKNMGKVMAAVKGFLTANAINPAAVDMKVLSKILTTKLEA